MNGEIKEEELTNDEREQESRVLNEADSDKSIATGNTDDTKFEKGGIGEYEKQKPILPTWERREEIGILRALWPSTIEILSDSKRTFSLMPKNDELGGPLLFGVIGGTIGLAGMLVFLFVSCFFFPNLTVGKEGTIQYGLLSAVLALWVHLLVFLLTFPILSALGVVVSAALMHLIMFYKGWARQNFPVTCRVCGYWWGANYMLMGIFMVLIPAGVMLIALVGSVLTHSTTADVQGEAIHAISKTAAGSGLFGLMMASCLIPFLIISLYGSLREALRCVHGLTPVKAFVVIFMPVFFFCGSGVFMVLSVMRTLVGKMSSMGGAPFLRF